MKDDINDKIRKVILALLAVIPMVAWVAYILVANATPHSATKPADVPAYWIFAGVASGTALATIAGDFLGVDINNNGRLATLPGRDRIWAILKALWSQLKAISAGAWATIVYLVGILIAVAFFVADDDKSNAAEVLKNAWPTLLGFGLGALRALAK